MAKPAHLSEYIIYVDPSKCVACKSCSIACAVEHSESKNIYQAVFEEVLQRPRTKLVAADNLYVPMRCMHCDPAPCVEACPTGAMHHTEEGFVLADREKCIGCRTCLLACPFGHPLYDSEQKVIKCDHCIDRFKAGLPPACVEACPTGALRYGRVEDLLYEQKRKKALEMILGVEEAGVVYAKVERAAPINPVAQVREMYKNVRWV